VTQAVHIEVVTSLTNEAFLAVLRYFIARRGRLRVIYSNIGTNVHGIQSTPGGLQYAAMSNPDDEGPGFPDNRRL